SRSGPSKTPGKMVSTSIRIPSQATRRPRGADASARDAPRWRPDEAREPPDRRLPRSLRALDERLLLAGQVPAHRVDVLVDRNVIEARVRDADPRIRPDRVGLLLRRHDQPAVVAVEALLDPVGRWEARR